MIADPELDARTALDGGDRKRALTVLMDAYGAQIYRHCLSFLGDRAWADDVHQVVFVQAYRDLDKFAGRSTWRTWLYAIARHRCLDAKKVRGRAQRRVMVASRPPERVDPAAGPEQRANDTRVGRALTGCLDKLNPRVRSAVLLRFQDGLSFNEIGDASGERAGTVQARVSRAMPGLRDCLKSHGVEL